MVYRKKVICMLCVIFFLSLIYALAFILDFAMASTEGAYTWMDSRFVSQADRIEISGSRGRITLLRKNNFWILPGSGVTSVPVDFPVKQFLVTDIFSALTKKGNYPVRSRSAAAREEMGLAENASRITIRGGAGLPLLDLLIGYEDYTGGLFLRKFGQSEIRSGPDVFTFYTETDEQFWQDLRIFPDMTLAAVQQIHLYQRMDKRLSLIRNRNNWELEGTPFSKGEAFLRSIIESQGEKFSPSGDWQPNSAITLELGNGTVQTLYMSAAGDDGSCLARLSDSPLVYSLSKWTIERIMPDASYFTEH